MAARLDQLGALAKAKRFLAREFLVWIWHQAENDDAPASFACPLTGQQRKFRFWIDDRLTLEATSGRVHLHQMRGGAPAQTPEAAAGILSGQTIRDLRIGFDVNGLGEFACTLSARDLSPRSVQLPVQADAGDVAMQTSGNAEPVGLRLDLTATFLAMMDALFAGFMQQRMEDSWPGQVAVMRQAAEQRYEKARKDVEREALQQDGVTASGDGALH
jgi:hypothetical protein